MTSETPDHGTVYMPCTEIRTITARRCDTIEHGTIASVDFGEVGVHIHTAAGARELLAAAVETMRILDPEGLAEFYAQILSERIAELLAEGDEDEPEDEPISLWPAYLRPEPAPVLHPKALPVAECRDCGATEADVPLMSFARIGADGVEETLYHCWSSANCDERQAARAGYR